MDTSDIEYLWKVATNDPNHDTNWYDPVVVAFAKLVANHTMAHIDPSSFMSYQEGYEAGKSAQNTELETLREFAAGRCAIQKVIDALGPMSLWSKSAFDAEIRKAVEAEREACAKLCEEGGKDESGRIHVQAWGCAKAIRARKEN